MKAVCTILLGLIMALSSFAVPANDSVQVRVCSCCSCAQLDCCGTPILPNPAPLSVPSKSTEQRAPALVMVALLTTPVSGHVPGFAIPSVPVLQGPAVPIYDRNCSYLI